jgi:hypothetical protein
MVNIGNSWSSKVLTEKRAVLSAISSSKLSVSTSRVEESPNVIVALPLEVLRVATIIAVKYKKNPAGR